jgi:hypothetical protein
MRTGETTTATAVVGCVSCGTTRTDAEHIVADHEARFHEGVTLADLICCGEPFFG